MYLPILYGTVRSGRLSIALARYVEQRLARRPGVETRIFDAAELPFGNLVQREWEMTDPDPRVAPFVAEMARADGFVIVTPEYNYSIPGSLKNVIDHLFDEWNHKPFAMVTTGGVPGGTRASDTLRQVISGIRAITVPAHVPVPRIDETFTLEGPKGSTEELDHRLDFMFAQLEWYAKALAPARAAGLPR